MRIVHLVLGLLSLGLGILGIVVPLLPTTPFLLLAAWLLARSSDRLHRWMIGHPYLGPPIREWRERRRIPLAARLVAVAMLAFSGVWVVLLSGMPAAGKIPFLVFLAAVAAWILTRRGRHDGERPGPDR
ncbi:MAG: DUF454 family protein [Deltaproteobacteria bacterium]|nr:DUF454 family protein [Deltaproteobacteria bacterium]